VSPLTGWCGLVISLTGKFAVTETEILWRCSEKKYIVMPSLASLWCNSAQADCTVKSCLACCAPLTERSSFFGCRDFLVNIFATTLRIWRGLLLRQLEDASFLDNKGLIYLYLNVIFYFLAEDSRSPEVGIRSYYFFYHGATAPVVQDLLISRIHDHPQLDTSHSVGLLWTNDQPDAESSTWQHTTLTRDRHLRPWRDSSP